MKPINLGLQGVGFKTKYSWFIIQYWFKKY